MQKQIFYSWSKKVENTCMLSQSLSPFWESWGRVDRSGFLHTALWLWALQGLNPGLKGGAEQFLSVCVDACGSILVSPCVCAGVSVYQGQDQRSKSTLERGAQSSSPTHLSLCLSHLADVFPHCSQFTGSWRVRGNGEQKSAMEAREEQMWIPLQLSVNFGVNSSCSEECYNAWMDDWLIQTWRNVGCTERRMKHTLLIIQCF